MNIQEIRNITKQVQDKQSEAGRNAAEFRLMPKFLQSLYSWFVTGDAPSKRVYNTGWDEHPILTWEPAPSIEFGGDGMGWNRITHPAGTLTIPQRKYFCACGTELTDGPTGGAAVNAVCEKCRLNYGCLPGYGL